MMNIQNFVVRGVLCVTLFKCVMFHLLTDTTMKVQAFVATTGIAIRPTAARNCRSAVLLDASVGSVVRSNEKALALDWSFLDGVYVIHCPNGDNDGSRMKATKDVLSDVNLVDNLQVKEFDTDDENRIRGCYTSHLSVYRDILAATSNGRKLSNGFDFFRNFQKNPEDDVNVNVLILEDNVALAGRPVKQEALDSIARFVSNKNDGNWDVVHLGKLLRLVLEC